MMYHFLRFLLMYIVLPKDYGVIYLVSPILHCSSLLSNPCQKSSFIFKNLGLIIKTCTHYAQFFIKHYPIYIYISVLLLCDSALTILPLLRGENDVAQKPFVAYVVSWIIKSIHIIIMIHTLCWDEEFRIFSKDMAFQQN